MLLKWGHSIYFQNGSVRSVNTMFERDPYLLRKFNKATANEILLQTPHILQFWIDQRKRCRRIKGKSVQYQIYHTPG